jgi:hypothetical protein
MKSSILPAIRSEGALDESKDIEICVEEWPPGKLYEGA